MQSFEERDQRRRFRRAQILSVSRHVATSLDDLADQLVLGQTQGNAVESWPPLPAQVSK